MFFDKSYDVTVRIVKYHPKLFGSACVCSGLGRPVEVALLFGWIVKVIDDARMVTSFNWLFTISRSSGTLLQTPDDWISC